ncbi:SDR family NAD(P)-dependent oxidoreductase [Jiulongibacter sediminis]|jgi:NAD(P)-dependent dehydrogenase (short-subunit alcohol dehydrogenase family)|uniref:SDR family NAD(P)-dependent oxidoreductase n=1 Tax=Jiulongibacter sediminis TaxID=1605367 RepID=UPI0026ED9F40|nr:SDR family oxidoreductase [Jiulongibacter sediminis]
MKTYLIIGASSGIGKTLAEKLSNQGHKVIATYFEHKTENQENLDYHHFDVKDSGQIDFLPETLDGLVYCPGSINLKPFGRLQAEDYLNDYQLQVVGFVNILNKALPALKKSKSGSILTFSTVAVQSGFPFHAQVSATKGALEGLTRALAAELAPNIRVNAIAPSITDTPLASKLLNSDQKKEANAERHPLKRIGSADDIASMAAFLLSDEATWITGQIHHIDGGISSIKN